MQQALLSAGLPPPGVVPPGVSVPGQYCGRVKSYNPKQGYGFLECLEARQHYGRDVFIHKAQMGDLLGRFVGPGTKLEPMALKMHVRFCVEVNKNGMPQARDVIRVEDAGEPSGLEGAAARELVRSEEQQTPSQPFDGGNHQTNALQGTQPTSAPFESAPRRPSSYDAAAAATPEAPPPAAMLPPGPPPLSDLPPEQDGVEGDPSAWGDEGGFMRGYKGRGGTIRILPGAEAGEASADPVAGPASQVAPPPAQAQAPVPKRGIRNRGWTSPSGPYRGSAASAGDGPPSVPWEHLEDETRLQPPSSLIARHPEAEARWPDFADPYSQQSQPQSYPAFAATPPFPQAAMGSMGPDGLMDGHCQQQQQQQQQQPSAMQYAVQQFSPQGMQMYSMQEPPSGSYGTPFTRAVSLGHGQQFGQPPPQPQPPQQPQYGTYLAQPQFQGYSPASQQQFSPPMMPYPPPPQQQFAMPYQQPAMHPMQQQSQQQPPPQQQQQSQQQQQQQSPQHTPQQTPQQTPQPPPPQPPQQQSPYYGMAGTPPSPGYGPQDCSQHLMLPTEMMLGKPAACGANDYPSTPSAIPDAVTPGNGSEDDDGPVGFPVFRGYAPQGSQLVGFPGAVQVPQHRPASPGLWFDEC